MSQQSDREFVLKALLAHPLGHFFLILDNLSEPCKILSLVTSWLSIEYLKANALLLIEELCMFR